MFDNFKPGDKIAEEKFIVTIPEDGTVIHYVYTLEKSGAFAYGNGTCVTVRNNYNGQQFDVFDTRYCPQCATVEGFREWAAYHLRKNLRPDCKIEREIPPAAKKTRTSKEYGIHFKSNDGKDEYITGHFEVKKNADASAAKHRRMGHKDVYIVERSVTAWKRVKA